MFAYVIDLMFVTLCTFFMLYKYRNKYISWKTKSDPTKKFVCELDMTKYALKIEGIPKQFEGLTTEEFERKISKKLGLMWPKVNDHILFIKFCLVGDYSEAYEYCCQLKNLIIKLRKAQTHNKYTRTLSDR